VRLIGTIRLRDVWGEKAHMKDRVKPAHIVRESETVGQFANASRDGEGADVFGEKLAGTLSPFVDVLGAEPHFVAECKLARGAGCQALGRESRLKCRRSLSSQVIAVSEELLRSRYCTAAPRLHQRSRHHRVTSKRQLEW
jgi:hypothetical protein